MKKLLILLIGTTATIAALVLVADVFGTRFIKNYLIDTFQNSCQTCEIEIGEIKTNLFIGEIAISDVLLNFGDPQITHYMLKAPKIVARLKPATLISGDIQVGLVSLSAPSLIITDGKFYSPKLHAKKKSRIFSIDKIEIQDGHFSYIRNEDGVLAKIQLKSIEASIGEVGNTPELVDQECHGEASAMLENSGRVKVAIKSHVFKSPLAAKVDVSVSEQNLSELNPYFLKSDGLDLSGHLVEGKGVVHINGNKLNAEVYAKYKNLKLKFLTSPDRNSITAFVMRLGGNLFIDPNNLDERRFQQTQSFELLRGKGSLVRFILMGFKGAALKIVTNTEGRRAAKGK